MAKKKKQTGPQLDWRAGWAEATEFDEQSWEENAPLNLGGEVCSWGGEKWEREEQWAAVARERLGRLKDWLVDQGQDPAQWNLWSWVYCEGTISEFPLTDAPSRVKPAKAK